MESRAKVEPDSGKHSVYTHFPKDPGCDICLKTKITRSSCWRRAGTVVPRAENFDDLITADHEILSEGSESRNNHRYAAVAQDLATQWLQSYPCKTKTSHETQKSLMKFVESTRKQKSFTLTILWNLASLLRNNHGIIVRQRHTRSENKWDCRKSSAQSEKRDICGIVAIRSGQRMVGGFHELLVLSVKYSISLVWWEDTIWKAVRNSL